MLISIGTLLLLLRFGVPGPFNTVHTHNSIHLHPLSNTNNILAAWHPFVSQHLPIPLSISRITVLTRRGLTSRLHRTRFRSGFERILLRAICGLQSIGSQDRLRRMRVTALQGRHLTMHRSSGEGGQSVSYREELWNPNRPWEHERNLCKGCKIIHEQQDRESDRITLSLGAAPADFDNIGLIWYWTNIAPCGRRGRSSPKWVMSTSLAWMSSLKLTLPPSVTKDSRSRRTAASTMERYAKRSTAYVYRGYLHAVQKV